MNTERKFEVGDVVEFTWLDSYAIGCILKVESKITCVEIIHSKDNIGYAKGEIIVVPLERLKHYEYGMGDIVDHEKIQWEVFGISKTKKKFILLRCDQLDLYQIATISKIKLLKSARWEKEHAVVKEDLMTEENTPSDPDEMTKNIQKEGKKPKKLHSKAWYLGKVMELCLNNSPHFSLNICFPDEPYLKVMEHYIGTKDKHVMSIYSQTASRERMKRYYEHLKDYIEEKDQEYLANVRMHEEVRLGI